jgi:hypothetical protein
MACERYVDRLADVAAGGATTPEVEAHLATCEACRVELQALREALALADAAMTDLLTAEPSPGLAVRIRQAVAEPESSPAWRFGWLWPAMAATATLLVALAVALGRGTGPTPEPRGVVDAQRPQPTGSTRAAEPAGRPAIPRDFGGTGPEGSAGLADPSPADATAGAQGESMAARSRSAARRAIPAEPEVLVPPGEADALLRFATHLQRRGVEPDSLLVADLSAPLPEPKAVEIGPLKIVPLDPAETSGTD